MNEIQDGEIVVCAESLPVDFIVRVARFVDILRDFEPDRNIRRGQGNGVERFCFCETFVAAIYKGWSEEVRMRESFGTCCCGYSFIVDCR